MADEVEVIVVPNGPDESWKQALAPFNSDARVRVAAITAHHANVARNHGLSLARGKYVRFLDDDDYLYAKATKRQHEVMLRTDVDICSGGVEIVDETGEPLDVLSQPNTNTFTSAILGPFRLPLPTAHLFKRTMLRSHPWDPSVTRAQDIVFCHDICLRGEPSWIRIDDVVGTWFQHRKNRVSAATASNEVQTIIARSTMNLVKTLASQDRLGPERADLAAEALWRCVHQAFYLDPIRWHQISRTAKKLSLTSKPDDPFFKHWIISGIDPILIEWTLLPKRYGNHLLRSMRHSMYGTDYRRSR